MIKSGLTNRWFQLLFSSQSSVYPSVGTTYVPTFIPTTTAQAAIPTAGADHVALSGAALLGLVGLAAFAL
jgi:hypothetical protein